MGCTRIGRTRILDCYHDMSKWFRPKSEQEPAESGSSALPEGQAATPDTPDSSNITSAPVAPVPERPKGFRERFVAVMTEPIHFGSRPQPPVPVVPEAPLVLAREAQPERAPPVEASAQAVVALAETEAAVAETRAAAERALSFRERLVAVLTEPITFGSKPADAETATAVAADSAEGELSVVESEAPRSLREKLAASARALTSSVGTLFKRNPKLDEDLLEELETALIQSDFGVVASTELVEEMRVRMRRREFADAHALLKFMRKQLRLLLVPYALPLRIPASPKPFVILTVGVNGAGKTTTIGKLAQRYKLAGHSVMLAAGDTFRAAAVEQLKMWGDRNQVPVISQGSGADSASVIFDALQAAKARGTDVLIADTAGRLHTQAHLMAELAKVKRVLAKLDPTAPHETLLVLDGGTGQNALSQARQFHQDVGLTGIVVTKLDGTAKGGTLFALCKELKLPIRFIGVGEKREDLREFDPGDFVDALLPDEVVEARD